jgi:hypothetical protein
MKHPCKRLLSFVLVFVMVLGMIGSLPIVASAAAPTVYTDILADDTASVTISTGGSAKYFRFVPTASGTYKFYSTNNTADSKASLLDASGNVLTTDDDSGSNFNFSITYDCSARTTYYIKAYLFSSSRTGSYTLNVDTISVDCEHNYVLESSTPATCSHEGSETYVCSLCGDTYTDTLPQFDHHFVEGLIVQDPTCTEEGSKHPDRCDLPDCELTYITAF